MADFALSRNAKNGVNVQLELYLQAFDCANAKVHSLKEVVYLHL